MPADGRAAQPRNPDDCQRAYVASAQRVSRLESVDRKLLRVSATLPSMRDHGDPLCTARVHVHLLEHSAPANGACDITMPLNCGAGTGGIGSADGSCPRRSAVIAPAGRHSRRRVGTNTRLADHRRVLYPRFSESLAAFVGRPTRPCRGGTVIATQERPWRSSTARQASGPCDLLGSRWRRRASGRRARPDTARSARRAADSENEGPFRVRAT